MQKYFFFLLCLISLQAYAQNTQVLKGRIVDRQSKSPLIGVTVVVLKTEPVKGAMTDADGVYLIREVPLGRQTLVCSYL